MLLGLVERTKRAFREERGFTAAELLVVATLSVVIIAALYDMFGGAHSTYKVVEEQNAAIQYGSRNLYELTKHVREAMGIVVAEPYRLKIRVDYDDDGIIEEIDYFLDDSTKEFKRTITDDGSTTKVIGRVVRNEEQSSPIFRYFDLSEQEIDPVAEPDEARTGTKSMEIHLIIDVNPGVSPKAYDTTTKVTLRNNV